MTEVVEKTKEQKLEERKYYPSVFADKKIIIHFTNGYHPRLSDALLFYISDEQFKEILNPITNRIKFTELIKCYNDYPIQKKKLNKKLFEEGSREEEDFTVNDGNDCICGKTDIVKENFVKNKRSNIVIKVGSQCIKIWLGYIPNDSIRCKYCNRQNSNEMDCINCQGKKTLRECFKGWKDITLESKINVERQKIDSIIVKESIQYKHTNTSEMSDTKYYLSVPFENKEEAKSQNARWCPEYKMWYSYDKYSPLLDKYRVIYLEVNFKEKENAKLLGAKFDFVNKKWYSTPLGDLKLIELYSEKNKTKRVIEQYEFELYGVKDDDEMRRYRLHCQTDNCNDYDNDYDIADFN